MNRQETIEYNRRQIVLMEERVSLYKNNKIGIGNFIDDIDALRGCIKNPPSDWVNSLSGWLWEIESIYAWALDQEKNLTTEYLKQIKSFVDRIGQLISWYKENCLSPIDEEEC